MDVVLSNCVLLMIKKNALWISNQTYLIHIHVISDLGNEKKLRNIIYESKVIIIKVIWVQSG